MPVADAISIIVPCYNDGEYLRRSIPSAAEQLGVDDEIVIIDDGSTDDTAAIVTELKSRLQKNIVYYRQENQGVSGARNTGIGTSRNPYLLFLDADDELLPDALASFRKCFDATTDFYIAGHRWIRGERVRERIPQLSDDRSDNFDKVLRKQLHIGNLSCMCFHRSVFETIQFDPGLKVGEDLVVILLTLATVNSKTVPAIVTNVHRRDGSLRDRADSLTQLESAVNQALFSHPCLPAGFQSFATAAKLKHYNTLLRIHWKNRDAARYVETFTALTRMSRTAWLTKWAWRRLIIKMTAKRNPA